MAPNQPHRNTGMFARNFCVKFYRFFAHRRLVKYSDSNSEGGEMMPITKAAPSRARTLVSSLYAVQLIGLCAMASSAPLMRRHSTAFAMVGFGPLRPPQPQLRHLRGGGLVPNPLSGACALITGAKRRVGQLAGRLGLTMNVDHDAEEILVSRIGLTSYGRHFPLVPLHSPPTTRPKYARYCMYSPEHTSEMRVWQRECANGELQGVLKGKSVADCLCFF